MAGTTPGEIRNAPDVLFNLTPDDDKHLQELDLLQLVNYGQLQKTITVPGTDGRTYDIDMALLWDEDHIDLLKRTQHLAGDPVLRVRVLRKLKLFKAIQKIDDNDYSDKQDPAVQRVLWAVLSKLSDLMAEQLEGHYKKIELERNMTAIIAIKDLNQNLDNTAPPEIKTRAKKDKQPAGHASTINEHQELVDQVAQKQQQTGLALGAILQENVEGKIGDRSTVTAVSPKQGEVNECS